MKRFRREFREPSSSIRLQLKTCYLILTFESHPRDRASNLLFIHPIRMAFDEDLTNLFQQSTINCAEKANWVWQSAFMFLISFTHDFLSTNFFLLLRRLESWMKHFVVEPTHVSLEAPFIRIPTKHVLEVKSCWQRIVVELESRWNSLSNSFRKIPKNAFVECSN